VASQCGNTPQYNGLETLFGRYKERGFEVLAFPANDFGRQEPGTSKQIREFCMSSYNTSFPLFEKIVATGVTKHPLYAALIAAQAHARVFDPHFRDELHQHGLLVLDEPELTWNFEKFLIDRTGHVIARFSPETPPLAPALIEAIESALAQPVP
jgi:glutathione peroxidase